jgi:hypothetical protein
MSELFCPKCGWMWDTPEHKLGCAIGRAESAAPITVHQADAQAIPEIKRVGKGVHMGPTGDLLFSGNLRITTVDVYGTEHTAIIKMYIAAPLMESFKEWATGREGDYFVGVDMVDEDGKTVLYRIED